MKIIRSLKTKLFIPLIIIYIIVFFSSSAIIIHRETLEAKDTLLSNTKSYSNLSVKYIIENYELYYDSGFLKFIEIINQIISLNEHVIQIQIVDLTGKILFDSIEIENGKYNEIQDGIRYIENNDTIEKSREKQLSIIEFNEKSYVEIIQPYVEEWGRHDYSVRYFISLGHLTALNNKILFEVFLSIGAFLLISFIFVITLFRWFITIPINKLSEGINQIKKGNLSHQIYTKSDDEIGDLTSTFNNMIIDLKDSKEKLEQSITQKNQLILQFGHDLKTPLGPILNLLKVISSHEKDPEKKEMLDMIQRNVDYIKNLVIKNLEIARLNSQNTDNKLSKINIRTIINNYLNNKTYLLETKKIKIENNIKNDYIINVNEYEFEIVISNLIENAIKYNIDNGKIIINAIKNSGYIKISIQDTGIGMTKDQIEHAFEEFYKADNSRHHLNNTGLGLSICKRIVEKYGGKIWIESDGLSKGTIVFFTLPVALQDEK